MARPTSLSPTVLCLVAIGLGTGAASSFVVSTTQPYTVGAPANYAIPPFVFGIILVLPVVAGFVAILARRTKEPGISLQHTVITALVVLTMLVAFVFLSGYFGSSVSGLLPPLHGKPPPSNNSTPPRNNSTPKNNSSRNPGSNGTTGVLPVFLGIPGWVFFVVAGAIGIGLVGLVVPVAGDWRARRRSLKVAAATAQAKRAAANAALSQALSELEEGTDPRRVIEQLYGRFLERVVPLAGDVDCRTPEEIRANILLPLGVRPPAAAGLTRLFEESRYSSHPMDQTKATIARESIGIAAADLARLPASQ